MVQKYLDGFFPVGPIKDMCSILLAQAVHAQAVGRWLPGVQVRHARPLRTPCICTRDRKSPRHLEAVRVRRHNFLQRKVVPALSFDLSEMEMERERAPLPQQEPLLVLPLQWAARLHLTCFSFLSV